MLVWLKVPFATVVVVHGSCTSGRAKEKSHPHGFETERKTSCKHLLLRRVFGNTCGRAVVDKNSFANKVLVSNTANSTQPPCRRLQMKRTTHISSNLQLRCHCFAMLAVMALGLQVELETTYHKH